MSEQNKALIRRWFEEVWNQGNESTIDELFQPEGESMGFPDADSILAGPEAFKAVYRQFTSAFSDIRVNIEEMISEGDSVAVRWTTSMYHRGDSLGFPASGKKASLSGSSFFHCRDGKIVNGWTQMDFTGLALQLQDKRQATAKPMTDL